MNYINFGEVLFDVFPDRATLGGAPLNAAVHMSRLGLDGMTVSALGRDELGERALSEIRELGMNTDGIAVIGKETGKAVVTLTDGNADYTFNDDNAWDNIPVPQCLPDKVDIIYYGTLARRAEQSRKTLDYILSHTEADHVFFDVNIRKKYYTKEIIRTGLEKATILKLNDEEVPVILEAADIAASGQKGLEELREKYRLSLVLLTLGSRGSMCLGDRWYSAEPEKAAVVDTVGAGDSLSAGFLASYMNDGDISRALRTGTKLASFVVTRRGAIPPYTKEALGL